MLQKHLLKSFAAFFLVLQSCNSLSLISGNSLPSEGTILQNVISKPQAVSTNFKDADTSFILNDNFGNNLKPASLVDLPKTSNGEYILAPGFYEGDFKSYCLHAGTHAASTGDGYLYAPLKGARAEIVENILRNSASNETVRQRNAQLLIWAVLSQAKFKDLSTDLKITASELLSPAQIYNLNGGALGLIPTPVINNLQNQLPSTVRNAIQTENKMRKLFVTGATTYEDFEKVAVLLGPSVVDHPEYKRGRWCKHPNGYYIRFFPQGYQRTKIQLYVPETNITVPSVSQVAFNSTNYAPVNLTFNPFDIVAVPANSEAQRLGIGGPWKEVIDVITEQGRNHPNGNNGGNTNGNNTGTNPKLPQNPTQSPTPEVHRPDRGNDQNTNPKQRRD